MVEIALNFYFHWCFTGSISMMGASLTPGRTVFFRPDWSFGTLTIAPSEFLVPFVPGIHKEETHALAEALRICLWSIQPYLVSRLFSTKDFWRPLLDENCSASERRGFVPGVFWCAVCPSLRANSTVFLTKSTFLASENHESSLLNFPMWSERSIEKTKPRLFIGGEKAAANRIELIQSLG